MMEALSPRSPILVALSRWYGVGGYSPDGWRKVYRRHYSGAVVSLSHINKPEKTCDLLIVSERGLANVKL